MERFLRPKWIVSHVFVGLLIVAMVIAGFWQLGRYNDRRDVNGQVTDRLEEPLVDIRQIASVDDALSVGDDVRFRLASATGEYQPDDEVLVLNRSLDGAPGYWVLTPLLLDDGTAVVVNRGWIPFRFEPGTPRPEAAPPSGDVTAAGMVRRTVEPEGIQSGDEEGVVLDALARPDLERYQQQLGYPILPVFIQLEAQDPAPADLPVGLPRPALDNGPHLSYAFQWFIFATIGIIGYPLTLRRIHRSEGKDGRHSDIPVDYL